MGTFNKITGKKCTKPNSFVRFLMIIAKSTLWNKSLYHLLQSKSHAVLLLQHNRNFHKISGLEDIFHLVVLSSIMESRKKYPDCSCPFLKASVASSTATSTSSSLKKPVERVICLTLSKSFAVIIFLNKIYRKHM